MLKCSAIVATCVLATLGSAWAQTEPEALRVVIGSGRPSASPGWELSMRRVTFPVGAAIPGEIHPGMQLVYVVSGELGLKVLGGEAQLRRALPDGSQGPVEVIEPGPNEALLRTGDTLLEPETLMLAPRNAGSVPLEILASSLLPVGAPQSVHIEQPVNPNGR